MKYFVQDTSIIQILQIRNYHLIIITDLVMQMT